MKKFLTICKIVFVCFMLLLSVSCDNSYDAPNQSALNLPTSSQGLSFLLNSDGQSYELTGIGECTDEHIVIGSYNNKPVTSIGYGAFSNQKGIESVTIQAVPIYHLEPNTRIFVRDDQSKINGEYIVSKISLPLAYNGTMSITATKAPERLI